MESNWSGTIVLSQTSCPLKIMLGLIAREPNFWLLKGGLNLEKPVRRGTVEETTFELLHLSLLREYLALEFGELKVSCSF